MLAHGDHVVEAERQNVIALDRRQAARVVRVGGVRAAADQVADGAVHQQVRVTADRRGEVGVGVVGQPEVALHMGLVLGLAHGAQHHGLDHLAVRPVGDGLAELLEHLRADRPFRPGNAQAQPAQELLQVGQALFLGRLVVPVERRQLRFLEQARGADIGRQHRLLDHHVGHVALHRHDVADLGLLIEQDAAFVALEVDGATQFPAAAQGQVHLVEGPHRIQGFVVQALHGFGGELGFRLLDNRAHLVVGEAVTGAHHAFAEHEAGDAAVGGHQHVAVKTQPVHVRVQRAQAVGQRLGQHRHHPVGEVHRVAALVRFVVQRRARMHIVADIGDRHDQTPAAALAAFHVDGVVEILGALVVDGDQRQVAQVHAVGLGGVRHLGAEALGFLGHALGPLVGDLEAAQRHLHFHAGLVRGGDHLEQAHQHVLVAGRILGDLGAHMVAVLGLDAVEVLDQHFLGDAAVFRLDEADPGFAVITADDLGDGALGDLHDARLFLAEAVDAGGADQHPVAVHHFFHLPGRQEQVLAAGLVGDQEAEAVAVALHPAGDQIHARGDAHLAVAVFHQLAVAQHRLEAALQAHLAVFVHVQEPGQVVLTERLSLVVEDLQDQLAAGNRILVLRRLPVRVGILIAFPGCHSITSNKIHVYKPAGWRRRALP